MSNYDKTRCYKVVELVKNDKPSALFRISTYAYRENVAKLFQHTHDMSRTKACMQGRSGGP